MRRSRSAVLFLLFLATGCQSVGRDVAGIRNFAKVDDELCRGAQPTETGIETLRSRGVRTVIDLRDDTNPAERGWVESRGMTYVHIPQRAALVEPDKLRRFLDLVESAPKPAFVHCKRGRDRTGLCVAVYRIAGGWDRERALDELYAHGHQWLFFPGIARYLRGFSMTPEVAEAHAGG